jgi:tRNA splicing endonuclease
VRLAHGVKKRMIFAFKGNLSTVQDSATMRDADQSIKYVDIGRMKL